jgi:hypothetical protein
MDEQISTVFSVVDEQLEPDVVMKALLDGFVELQQPWFERLEAMMALIARLEDPNAGLTTTERDALIQDINKLAASAHADHHNFKDYFDSVRAYWAQRT